MHSTSRKAKHRAIQFTSRVVIDALGRLRWAEKERGRDGGAAKRRSNQVNSLQFASKKASSGGGGLRLVALNVQRRQLNIDCNSKIVQARAVSRCIEPSRATEVEKRVSRGEQAGLHTLARHIEFCTAARSLSKLFYLPCVGSALHNN
jgi:hypothetical protein